MRQRILTAIKIILILLVVALAISFLVPMPHGGTIGGNIAEGIKYELEECYSSEAKAAREKEEEEWQSQKEEAKQSWERFEQENPQYFPKK